MLEQALKDDLTGFFLRSSLISFLRQLISQYEPSAKAFSIALIDIDHFKQYNDKYGHAFGDEILKYSSSTLRLTFFEGQCALFRYGGDEFVAVFPDKTPKETLLILRRCQKHLRRRPCLFKNRFFRVHISAGIAGFPEDSSEAGELLQKADEAMYYSKRAGRDRTSLYSRLRFMRLRRIASIWILVVLLIAAAFAVWRMTYKVVAPALSSLRHMQIVTKPLDLDKIILRNGLVFEGKIISESRRAVVMQLYFERGGEASMTFKRPEVRQIKYAAKASRQAE